MCPTYQNACYHPCVKITYLVNSKHVVGSAGLFPIPPVDWALTDADGCRNLGHAVCKRTATGAIRRIYVATEAAPKAPLNHILKRCYSNTGVQLNALLELRLSEKLEVLRYLSSFCHKDLLSLKPCLPVKHGIKTTQSGFASVVCGDVLGLLA